MSRYVGEFLGTFAPVFAGTGAIIADDTIVALEAMFAGPITGASMNPARSLAPALVSGTLRPLWIYLTAPLIGAALAILSCRLIRTEGCCVAPDPADEGCLDEGKSYVPADS